MYGSRIGKKCYHRVEVRRSGSYRWEIITKCQLSVAHKGEKKSYFVDVKDPWNLCTEIPVNATLCKKCANEIKAEQVIFNNEMKRR